MTAHGPERRGPERPGPDYPAEWDREPEEDVMDSEEVERVAAALWEAQEGCWVAPWADLSPTTPTRDKYRRYARAAIAARPSADTETLRDALRLIAGPAPHCSASTTERHACRQPGSGRTRGARYGADAWCDQCIAYAALDES